MSDEQVLADVLANLFRGLEGVGGKMKITNRRIFFQPHRFNFQREPADIPLDQIAEVRKRSTCGIIPNGMLVRLKSGEVYKFVVWNRQRLITLIRGQLPGTPEQPH